MKKREEDNRIVSHVASLVLGIISIVTILFWYMSIPTGIVSIVLGVNSYKRYDKKLGLAGMITGIVGVSICLLVYISVIILVVLENGGY